MPRPTSRLAQLWAQGYGRGSVYASMTRAEQKAFRQWMEAKAADARAYERGLGSTARRSRSSRSLYAEV